MIWDSQRALLLLRFSIHWRMMVGVFVSQYLLLIWDTRKLFECITAAVLFNTCISLGVEWPCNGSYGVLNIWGFVVFWKVSTFLWPLNLQLLESDYGWPSQLLDFEEKHFSSCTEKEWSRSELQRLGNQEKNIISLKLLWKENSTSYSLRFFYLMEACNE